MYDRHNHRAPLWHDMTLGELVVLAFERAEGVADDPARTAELASTMVIRKLLRSPRNAEATQRLLQHGDERRWSS